ncbi:MAG: DUF1292 domain-containing protein [Acholeplasmataceae bacterium]|nr:MAG: DUF1292 domain-containing protein [Acholeplasmataceae bacterium]
MLKENQIMVTDENGVESICEILFTHEVDGKQYVVFEFVDSEEVSAAIYVPGENEQEGTFEDIETEEEWAMLDDVLQKFYDEIDAELDEEEDEEEPA